MSSFELPNVGNINIDGYNIDLTVGPTTDQVLQYNGSAFIAGTVSGAESTLFRSFAPIPTQDNGPVSVNRIYTIDLFVPSDVTTIKVRGSNRTFNGSLGTDASTNIALYASDGSGNPTGSSTGDGYLILAGDGTVNTTVSLPVTRGSDGKVIMVYSFPNPSFVNTVVQIGLYNDSTTTVDPLPGGWSGPNPDSNFWLEFEYDTAKRKIIVLGDSISVGYNSSFEVAAWNDLAADKDFGIGIEGVVQYGSYQNFADYSGFPFLWDEITPILPGNDVVLQLGTNDLAYNDLSAMQTVVADLITHLNLFDCGNIYAWTIPPQQGYPGTDSTRTAFNLWLKQNQAALGIYGIYDAAAPQNQGGLADNSNSNALYSSFDSGDGTHPSATGHIQIKTGWEVVTSGRAISGTILNTQIAVGSGINNITGSNGLTLDGYNNLTVGGKIITDGYSIDLSAGASTNQVLQYNGTSFIAATIAGGGIGGSIANHQVAYGNSTNITGSANLTFDGSIFIVSGTDGDGSLVGPMRVASPSAGTVGAWFTLDNSPQTSGRKWSIGSGGSATPINGAFYVGDNTAAAYRMSIDSSGSWKLHAPAVAVTIGSDGKLKGPTEYWGLSAGSGKLIIDDGSNGSKLAYNSNYVSVDSSNVNLVGSSILTNTGSLKYTGTFGTGTSTAFTFRTGSAAVTGDKLFSFGDSGGELVYLDKETVADIYVMRSTGNYIGMQNANGDGIIAQGANLVYIYGANAPQMLFTANTSITNGGAFPISIGTSGIPWDSFYGRDGYFSRGVSLGGSGGTVGFYGTTPIAQQSGGSITTVAGVVAALQALGLLGV